MNKVVLMGRLTRDPEVRYTQGEHTLDVARFTQAVDRRFKKDGEPEADFISCCCFGKVAEHFEKYYRKGMRTIVSGRIQTGSYTNKDGVKVYTTDVIVEDQEFAESKAAAGASSTNTGAAAGNAAAGHTVPNAPIGDGFMNIPDGMDEKLPFS